MSYWILFGTYERHNYYYFIIVISLLVGIIYGAVQLLSSDWEGVSAIHHFMTVFRGVEAMYNFKLFLFLKKKNMFALWAPALGQTTSA